MKKEWIESKSEITQKFLDEIVTWYCDGYTNTLKQSGIKIGKNRVIVQLKENCNTPIFLSDYGLKKILKDMKNFNGAVFVNGSGCVYKIIISKNEK